MMEVFSMVAMNAAIPELAFGISLWPALMALVAVTFGLAAAVVFHVRRAHEGTLRRRTTSHLRIAQRPAFGAAH